jgi:hypothetical protein
VPEETDPAYRAPILGRLNQVESESRVHIERLSQAPQRIKLVFKRIGLVPAVILVGRPVDDSLSLSGRNRVQNQSSGNDIHLAQHPTAPGEQ